MRGHVQLWIRHLHPRLARTSLATIFPAGAPAALCALLTAFLFGCAAVPQKELAGYRSAFEQGRTAAQEVLLDYSNAKDELDKRRAAQAQAKASGAPRPALTYQFAYQTVVSRSATKVDDIGERIRALETIARYNQLLADLAEGKSAEQAAASAGELLGTIGTFTSLVPGLGPLVTNAVMALEKARSRQELVNAVRAGEPVVVAILDFFMAEVPRYYQVRRDLLVDEMEDVFGRIDERLEGLERAARGSDITGKMDLGAYEKTINQELSRTGRARRAAFPAPAKPAAATAQDPLLTSYFAQSTLALTGDIRQYLSLSEKLNAYLALLQRYELMLDTTKKAMIALRVAVDAPQDVTIQFEDLLQTTLLLRRDFMKFRSQL